MPRREEKSYNVSIQRLLSEGATGACHGARDTLQQPTYPR